MSTHEALSEFVVVGDLPLARSAIVMRKGSSPLSSASFSMRFTRLMTFVPCPLLELPYLGKEKIVEVQRRLAHLSGDTADSGLEAPPLLRLGPWHEGPADFLRVLQNAGLDGFVFGGGGHGKLIRRTLLKKFPPF